MTHKTDAELDEVATRILKLCCSTSLTLKHGRVAEELRQLIFRAEQAVWDEAIKIAQGQSRDAAKRKVVNE